jgi:hypothetical protein
MCCEVVSVMIVTKVPYGEVTNSAHIMNYSSNRALNRVFTSTKRKHRRREPENTKRRGRNRWRGAIHPCRNSAIPIARRRYTCAIDSGCCSGHNYSSKLIRDERSS